MLHGGANLALAETIAGFGSMLSVDIQHYDIRGIQVSANHTGKADQVDPAERSRQSIPQLESAGRPADPARNIRGRGYYH
jgi:hypothetical protein